MSKNAESASANEGTSRPGERFFLIQHPEGGSSPEVSPTANKEPEADPSCEYLDKQVAAMAAIPVSHHTRGWIRPQDDSDA